MLTRYIHAAMRQAVYELLEDGTFYGDIPLLTQQLDVGRAGL